MLFQDRGNTLRRVLTGINDMLEDYKLTGKSAALAAAITLIASPAAADTWLNVGGVSKHFSGSEYNEVNNGYGIETGLDKITVSAGVYSNSLGRESVYFMAEKVIVKKRRWGAGLAGGIISGYGIIEDAFKPVALPIVRWDGDTVGLRGLIIPPVGDVIAAVAVQFRIRIK